jgi:hypothetical protein
VLKDPIGNKRCQHNEKQIRPFGNPLTAGAGAFHLSLRRGSGTAVVERLNIAYLRVKFHLKPFVRGHAPFFFESNVPV